MPAALLSLQLNTRFVRAGALWVIAASLAEVRVNKIRACVERRGFDFACTPVVLARLCQSVMSAHLHTRHNYTDWSVIIKWTKKKRVDLEEDMKTKKKNPETQKHNKIKCQKSWLHRQINCNHKTAAVITKMEAETDVLIKTNRSHKWK